MITFLHRLYALSLVSFTCATLITTTSKAMGAMPSVYSQALVDKQQLDLRSVNQAKLEAVIKQLNSIRSDLAEQVSECNGGMIMIIVCPVPSPKDSCKDIAPCEVVEALKETDKEIQALDKLEKLMQK